MHREHAQSPLWLLLAVLLLQPTARANAQENSAPTPASPFQAMMALAGWTSDAYQQFADDRPLDTAASEELAKLFQRLRSIPVGKLSEWAIPVTEPVQLLGDPAAFRGELFRLSGQIVRVAQEPAAGANSYFRCEIALDEGDATVEVLAPSVPAAWLKLSPLDQPVVCAAVFLRRTATPDEDGRLQFVAPRIAWYPTRVHLPEVSFGMTVLSSLGVNLTDWDAVKVSGSLGEDDYEAFYQTLAAMRKTSSQELAQLAGKNLPSYAAPFRAELAKLDERLRDSRRGLVLREIVKSADAGRYSVIPLFLEPATQRGELVALEGVVRRVVRVDTAIGRDGAPSEVVERFGIDHYYEIELFTEDSENLPLVCCVLELPEDFPTGDDLHEAVRLAGFFFKTWIYRGRGASAGVGVESLQSPPMAKRTAPLLIGHGPLRISHSSAAAAPDSMLVGGLVGLAIAGLWFAAWWYARSDRQFARTTLSKYLAPNDLPRIEPIELPKD